MEGMTLKGLRFWFSGGSPAELSPHSQPSLSPQGVGCGLHYKLPKGDPDPSHRGQTVGGYIPWLPTVCCNFEDKGPKVSLLENREEAKVLTPMTQPGKDGSARTKICEACCTFGTP